jgi:leucyl aminopeptidase
VQFSIRVAASEKRKTACAVVGLFESRKLSPSASRIDDQAGGVANAALKRADFEGKAGTTLLLPGVAGAVERILLVGLGKESEFGEKEFLAALRTSFRALDGTGAKEATLTLAELPVRRRDVAWRVRQTAIAAIESGYRFDQFKTKATPPTRKLTKLAITIADKSELPASQHAIEQGTSIAKGVILARDLGNLPANVCTPTYLAERVVALGTEYGFSTEVLDREEMIELGMGALLSVAAGSEQPPRLIVAQYAGGGDTPPVVLVGKGITFDSGGISLNPGEGMDEMKYDMCGAASVIGTLVACAAMKLPVNLCVLVPATENMPSGRATRPGDIVRSMSGQTVEILNTDAEGRLILCDTLTYAERFSPAAVIDVATLTGACVIALGHVTSGLFSTDDPLANDLLEAGKNACDAAWRMPIADDYQEQLKSNFADMANIGGRPAGAITAACFLSRFAGKYPWAHLDIAGTAWKSGVEKGATGRPVSLLSHYLLDRCGLL